MKDYWSEYWSQGFITSFGQDIKRNYTGLLKNCWLEFTDTLEKNSRILDIGTGNGALIELIQTGSKAEYQFVGIDSATINKNVSETIKGQFISNIKAEKMPFKDNEFDAVISQFALEYSDITLSINELFRVLTSGGQFQLICHDVNSDIVLPNIQILESALRVKNNFLTPLQSLVSTILATSDEADIQSKVAVIDDLLIEEKTIHALAINATQMPAFFSFLLKNRKIDLNKAFSLFKQELEGLIYRLNDLQHAAQNSACVHELLLLHCQNVEKTYLIDNNKEKIGTLYKGRK
ncbi:class I SAM-dependent methyltransferase [Pseudoalteromonas sp. MMG010]|uniref:class I SAM-dependent methyltransferase n=1 Tax=Pseudoalteromonas sp. MMG010 TaxID=2822685 RepID=UPI001B39ECC4|nr:class I SAM-dependent methyltransferase [Pseudoalteromonas sp. MMG010]MBQ4831664.1 class I SAM-dependent methyltransferase [Pseudoalteromonas sp. MMG010]